MATTDVCSGIGCGSSHPAPDADRGITGEETHRGWIDLRVDGDHRRFCSWNCLVSFANDRMQVTAGD